MTHANSKPSIGLRALWVLAVFGAVLMFFRWFAGLGAATNLSDGYPWGFWIGVDILAGIALAAGGFVLAGTVHLFGGHKFHALARPAILAALLGYLMFIFGLFIDLGRPWNLWRALFHWNHESPMFEVAWCVMLYTTVLILEFLPVIFERYRLANLHDLWRKAVPWIIIGMLALFTLAMTDSFMWALVITVVLLFWEVAMRGGWMPRDKQMPILLIMSGVMFSTMHQSSLGTLFLLVPQKLHVLWYSPLLPLFFLLSAVMVGPAMVIFEALLSERVLGHKSHFHLLSSLSKAMPYLLGIYLLLKVADIVGQWTVISAFSLSAQTVSWWMELSVGVILPLVLYLSPDVRNSRSGLMWTSLLVVVGVLWNRINVAIVGVIVKQWETYYPHWIEIFITVGIVSIGLLVFRWVGRTMPVYEGESPSHA
ncbi:Ni/Fe-hydrogenase cytochrome b subunit [bacterium]|nr:Ni/Fe-hydrogenase cytochrome b subunit [bacterium]